MRKKQRKNKNHEHTQRRRQENPGDHPRLQKQSEERWVPQFDGILERLDKIQC